MAWTIDALGKFVLVGSELATIGDREVEDTGNPGVDGRYHVGAGMGDNSFGSGLHSLEIAGASVVYNVGGGNTAGSVIVEAKGGVGLVFEVVGPIDWMAVMPVNGVSFEAALAAAKSW